MALFGQKALAVALKPQQFLAAIDLLPLISRWIKGLIAAPFSGPKAGALRAGGAMAGKAPFVRQKRGGKALKNFVEKCSWSVLTGSGRVPTSFAVSTRLMGVITDIRTWIPMGVYQMAFTPLHDRVLVRRVQSEEKTKGGLIIPDTAKEKPAEGVVVSVGAGARKDSGELIAPAVKAGDRVLFGKWSGTEVTVDGEELLIMKESDILGIIG